MRKVVRVLVTATAVAALATAADQTAVGAPARTGSSTVDAAVLAAIKRDVGLDAAQVDKLRSQQENAARIDRKLRAALGRHHAGSWFDAGSGTLTVALTDSSRTAEVTEAGAKAEVVEYDLAHLDAIKTELDLLSGRAPGSARAKPVAASKVPDLAGWYVDPVSNSVVVTAIRGRARSAGTASLARHGKAVRIRETDSVPRPAGDYLDGGDEINFANCSAGFNLRDPFTGQGYLLTAGHCVTSGRPMFGQGVVRFGTVLESWFPGPDDALVQADNQAYWTQGPWVDTHPSNGGFVNVSGWSDSPVGTLVCKSGVRTKWTCGWIRAKNETVSYDPEVVYGMTRHSACVEPGDSGGANVAALSVWSPEGVTSGARLSWDGSRWRCAQAVGADESVSWYFPIASSLAYYGQRYGVITW